MSDSVELHYELCEEYRRNKKFWSVQLTHRQASVLLLKRYVTVKTNTIVIEKWYYTARYAHIKAALNR